VSKVEGTVTHLLEHNGMVHGVAYTDADGNSQKVRAPLTVVCDGIFSLLRKSLNEADIDVRSKFLGLILKDCKLPTPNTGHVVLAEAPILIYPITSKDSRMLIDFPNQIPDVANGDLRKYLMENVLPILPKAIHKSFIAAAKEPAFLSMPNRSLVARPLNIPGVLLMGDALNMRHPLTGGGMTVAFRDVKRLVSYLETTTTLTDRVSVSRVIDKFYHDRRADNVVINILADALYGVFCAESLKLRDGCYEYLMKGGWFSHGPISFLSGLNKSQLFLLTHFYLVMAYGMVLELSHGHFLSSFKICRRALIISLPLIERENRHFSYGIGLLLSLCCRLLGLTFWIFW